MRWLPFIAIFLYVYIEISIFIQVAHVLGVLLTLVLVIFTSVIGMSLVRNQGFKNFVLMQQKMAAGENPAAEMIKSVSLIIAGLLLLLPGFFHRLPRSSAFITAGAKASDSEVDAAFALFSYARRRF
ncbi:protein FxsA (Suppressor of F exclusion of phage T7) [Escherichia coli TA271]|nr:protein FxsA (Suppressor of F exclusion of phage T7) [Escherichia coli TA271]